MDTKWSHLPNARLIDWVIDSVTSNTKKWGAAWNAAWDEARDDALNAAWGAAWKSDHNEAWNAAWGAIWIAVYNESDGCRDKAYDATLDAVSALLAYDDADQYLSMSYSELKVLALLSEHPAAILLLPMKWVQENECLVTSA